MKAQINKIALAQNPSGSYLEYELYGHSGGKEITVTVVDYNNVFENIKRGDYLEVTISRNTVAAGGFIAKEVLL